VFGCSGTKKSSKKYLAEAPEWVRKSPVSPGFYHGVGSANKANTRMDFHEKARQNALSDLAGNISVKISSSSVLNQYEYDNNYSEYFRDNIKLSSDEYLEGYELVDSWESDGQYWVYYRLSKQKYEQVKVQRKNDAISKSMGNLAEASKFKNSGNLKESIRFNIKALEDVKNFLGDEMEIEMDGTKQAYGSVLLSDLTAALQQIRIIYPEESIAVKRGKTPETNPVIIKVLDDDGRPVSGMSINTSQSWAPGKIIVTESNVQGESRIELDKADTKKTEEFIESKLNIEKLIRESTSDPVIRKLTENISIPEFVLPVYVVTPSFFIELQESNLGKPLDKSILFNVVPDLLNEDGFPIVDRPEVADLILSIRAITKTNTERNGMFSATMSASILVTDNFGRQVYALTVDDLSGLSDSFEAAGFDAYDALTSKFRINIYPEMYKKLFK
jgi:hypothetical protein